MKQLKYYVIFLASCLSLNSYSQISGVINSYHKVTNYVSAYNGVRLANVSGLQSGDRVLLIQMKGAQILETESASYGNITAINASGFYEFATICGFLNDTVIFERLLKNTYDFSSAVQLVRIPVYSDVIVTGTLRAQEWSPVTETGGILAIASTGTITLNANISADSAGFKGGTLQSFANCNYLVVSSGFSYNPPAVTSNNNNGTYKGEGINYTTVTKEGGKGKQSNGGGGGNNHNSGGGGGANYGAGGNGGRYTASGFACNGTNVGVGGVALSAYGYTSGNNRIFPGGGGGAGHDNNGFGTPGGKGGGIVFIECNQLTGNGYSVSANGSQGINIGNPVPNEARGDGGGGGGAGGTILLNVGTYSGNINISAKGADGSRAGFMAQCPGPGGGGGGGVIWANTSLPLNVTTNVAGGVAGIINDALENPSCELTSQFATAGSTGAVLTDFTITYNSTFNCLGILPSSNVIHWSGRKTATGVSLNWKIISADNIEEILLQKRGADNLYSIINRYQRPINGTYNFVDYTAVFPAVYRLVVINTGNVTSYTNPLFFGSGSQNLLRIMPNPAGEKLSIQHPFENGFTSIIIYDVTGRTVSAATKINAALQKIVTVSLQHLPAGYYTVVCFNQGNIVSAGFVKQ